MLRRFQHLVVYMSFLAFAGGAGAESNMVLAQAAEATNPAVIQAQTAAGPDNLKQGVALLNDGSYEEAVTEFVKARELEPGSSKAAYYLGSAYKKAQDYQNALKHFTDAVLLKPIINEAYLELADTYYQLDRFDDAYEALLMAERSKVEPSQTAFLKGLVLTKRGENAKAVAEFIRAKTSDPKLTLTADYQIATAYMQQGKLKEARDLFKDIVIRDPNSELAPLAEQYAQALTKRIVDERPLKITAAVSYQYDSNVILKPSDSKVAAAISGEADTSAIATLRAEYDPKIYSDPYGMKLQYSLYMNAHSELKDYDVQSHAFTAAPSRRFASGSASLLAGFNFTLVNNKAYQETISLSPIYAFAPFEGQYVQTTLKYESKNYDTKVSVSDEDRNGSNMGAGVSWFTFFLPGSGFLNIRYDLDKEDTKGSNWRYTGNRFGATFLYPIQERFKITAGADVYFQSFDSPNTSFSGTVRKDKTYTLNMQTSYTLLDALDINAQFAYIQGDSNIPVYGYNKYTISAGLEARF